MVIPNILKGKFLSLCLWRSYSFLHPSMDTISPGSAFYLQSCFLLYLCDFGTQDKWLYAVLPDHFPWWEACIHSQRHFRHFRQKSWEQHPWLNLTVLLSWELGLGSRFPFRGFSSSLRSCWVLCIFVFMAWWSCVLTTEYSTFLLKIWYLMVQVNRRHRRRVRYLCHGQRQMCVVTVPRAPAEMMFPCAAFSRSRGSRVCL